MNQPEQKQENGSVIQGDCLEVLTGMPSNHFDALVTDPP
jgi:predicted methyltransferase